MPEYNVLDRLNFFVIIDRDHDWPLVQSLEGPLGSDFSIAGFPLTLFCPIVWLTEQIHKLFVGSDEIAHKARSSYVLWLGFYKLIFHTPTHIPRTP